MRPAMGENTYFETSDGREWLDDFAAVEKTKGAVPDGDDAVGAQVHVQAVDVTEREAHVRG